MYTPLLCKSSPLPAAATTKPGNHAILLYNKESNPVPPKLAFSMRAPLYSAKSIALIIDDVVRFLPLPALKAIRCIFGFIPAIYKPLSDSAHKIPATKVPCQSWPVIVDPV